MSFKVEEDVDFNIRKLVLINNTCQDQQAVLKYSFECKETKCSESLLTMNGDTLKVSPNKTEPGPIKVNVTVGEAKGAKLYILFQFDIQAKFTEDQIIINITPEKTSE